MRKIWNGFLLYFTICLVFSACQKVINIKLDSAPVQYVIEGVITDQPGPAVVHITKTKDFSGDNNFPGVSGATVTVEDNGVVATLNETDSGIYQTAAIAGKPGDTYNLKVVIGGSVFTATSTMPNPVGLDSIYVSTGTLTTKKYASVIYQDPPGIANYYRFVQYVNGRQEKTIFVNDDEFTDGQKVTGQLEFFNDTDDSRRDIKSGDSVKIDMLCLDKAVYKYWYTLRDDASGNSRSTAPSNPVSNIQGGCMGYFSAQTYRTRSLLVGK